MARPTRYLIRMIFFLIAILATCGVLYDPLFQAFMANPYLNGVIAVTLIFGITYVFRLVVILGPEVEWARQAAQEQERAAPSGPPRLLAPVAVILSAATSGRPRLSALSLRSLLDGVAARLEEGREISRYFTSVMVFLGLLGTFYGLLITIGQISGTISGLNVDSGDVALMFDALKDGLQGPLGGMATAFSSSLFGLAGSMILGFLDLQAGQAQNRFYTDVEDWLTGSVRITTGVEAVEGIGIGGGAGAYVTALMEQAADDVSDLRRALKSAEDRAQSMDGHMRSLAEGIAGLADQVRAQRKSMDNAAENQQGLLSLTERLVRATENREAGLDEAAQSHLRAMDLSLKALLDGQKQQNDAYADALRQEMKLLARALAEQPRPDQQNADTSDYQDQTL